MPLAEPVFGYLRAFGVPEPLSGKELVTWGPPFLMACLPAALIIAPIVLKDRARLLAYARGSEGESDESVNAAT